MKKYMIPVTVIETVSKTAWAVFNIEGDTEEEQMQNILALENMHEADFVKHADLSIQARVDLKRFPPLVKKESFVHSMDAEPF